MIRRKSVLILQGEIVAYREPIFNALAEDYNVTVLHSGKPFAGPEDRYSERIIPVRKFGPLFVQNPCAVLAMMAKFNVTISMFDLRWPAFLLPAFLKRGGRFIFHGHRYSGRAAADRLRDFLMKRADCLLMYGDEEIEAMIRRGIDPAKIVVAPNTMIVDNHADFSRAPKSSILFVGRLQERKRLDLAFEIFARLQGRIPEHITFDVVGAGEPEAALRDKARQLGIAHKVKFHGRIVDNAALEPLFRRAIVYASPGPVGLGVLHSFAFGVPVITLRSGRHGPEFHNLVDNTNALVATDETEYEQALLRICSEPVLAARLGQAAYRVYAEERGLKHMLAGFIRAIEG